MEKLLNNRKGITLIALVITIIVLLILAGVTIATLTGENGILKNASSAKVNTDIASIKEKAELVKLGMETDIWSARSNAVIKRSQLVNAIKEEFSGSTKSGSVVTTTDGYDIVVDNDLNITVVKRQDRKANEITFASSGLA